MMPPQSFVKDIMKKMLYTYGVNIFENILSSENYRKFPWNHSLLKMKISLL